jgi:hypothetical protein
MPNAGGRATLLQIQGALKHIFIFILQKAKKHLFLNKRFGRQCFISRDRQGRNTLAANGGLAFCKTIDRDK